MTKFCPRCERDLPFEKFSKAQKRREGLRANCRDCEAVLWKAKVAAVKEKIYDKLGHTCCKCGFGDKRALQIDHIFGGGNQEHGEIKNHLKYLKKVLDDTSGLYQMLCANCNWIKRIEKLEHRKPNPFTSEEIQKILQSNYGKPISDATRKRLSEAGKGKVAWNVGVPAWNRGEPRTAEDKAKISEACRAAWASKTPEERKVHCVGRKPRKPKV